MKELLTPLYGFKEQFSFTPSFDRRLLTGEFDEVVICGMGGSGIAVSLLKLFFPDLPITLHNEYGLPKRPDLKRVFFILNSYSGNTEEVLDSFDRIIKEGLSVALVSKGGELIRRGQERGAPYITLPESGIEPRFAIGHQMLALLTILGEEKKIATLREHAEKLDVESLITSGETLAKRNNSKIPILYTSSLLTPLAYPIKAAINEGAKMPSFCNTISESNHNELQGFISEKEEDKLSEQFAFYFFSSSFDHQRIQKRMEIMKRLYSANGFSCELFLVDHTDIFSLLEILFVGYAFATTLAIERRVDPYKTPFIGLFKEELTK